MNRPRCAGRSGAASVLVLTVLLALVLAPAGLAAQARHRSEKILVSLETRELWLVAGGDTLFHAPIAIGRGDSVTYAGKTYHWGTPRGERHVLRKRDDPVWTVPEWHYYERAANEGLKLVKLRAGRSYPLADGTRLEARGDQVGRIDEAGRFWTIQPGFEIVIDGTLYVPPENSVLRRVPDALGPRALDLGGGYLIHGVHEYDEESVGEAASHGCIRMRNEDVARLYDLVPVGTPVFIF